MYSRILWASSGIRGSSTHRGKGYSQLTKKIQTQSKHPSSELNLHLKSATPRKYATAALVDHPLLDATRIENPPTQKKIGRPLGSKNKTKGVLVVNKKTYNRQGRYCFELLRTSFFNYFLCKVILTVRCCLFDRGGGRGLC